MSFNWNDNTQAFPRVIAELVKLDVFTGKIVEMLCEEMKLEPHELATIIVRAERRAKKDSEPCPNWEAGVESCDCSECTARRKEG